LVTDGRTRWPIGTGGTPTPTSSPAKSGGAHTRTSAPSAASPTIGSTPQRDAYVDNNACMSLLPFLKRLYGTGPGLAASIRKLNPSC
jgi:hypothetical protein